MWRRICDDTAAGDPGGGCKEELMADIDRTNLPIRRPRFSGVVDRTLAGSEPDWNLIGHPTPPRRRTQRPARPDRRRRVRQPEHVRRPDRDAQLHPHGRGRPPLQPVPRHRHLLADPGGAADRPQQPRGRLRLDRRVRRRLSGLFGDSAPRLRAAAADPARQRLQHRGVRQVAPDPDGQQGPAGPFDRWPNGWGFDYF